jgi:alkylhydroperoxidase family enzyme
MGRLAAVLVEDCGSCVQIEVNLARKAGIPVEYLKAALAGDVDRLPGELADAYRFARAVAADKGGEEEYRNRLQKHFGEEGVAELATGIAAARVYPALKRGLGYAVSCSRLPVDV